MNRVVVPCRSRLVPGPRDDLRTSPVEATPGWSNWPDQVGSTVGYRPLYLPEGDVLSLIGICDVKAPTPDPTSMTCIQRVLFFANRDE